MEPRDFLEVMEAGEKLESSLNEQRAMVPNFDAKLAKLIGLIANESGYRRHTREYLLREAATVSEFPILFGTILDRQLLAKYKIATPDWKTYIATGTQRDFRPQSGIGLFGLQGALSVVPPRGEYPSDASLGTGKADIVLSKYGRIFSLGWEILINDDLGAFSDIAERLANSALRTEFRYATWLFCKATGPNPALYGAPIAHPIDGRNVTNLFTGNPLTVDNLGLSTTAMRRQTDSDNEPIMIEGFELVVPPKLEYTMLQILRSTLVMIAGTTDRVRPTANVVPELNITGHVNPYLPILDVSGNADKTWYLFAKLSSGSVGKVNFLIGHEAPELCMKNPDKITLGGGMVNPLEGDFESDAVAWRIRHIMGGNVWEPRMSTANIG